MAEAGRIVVLACGNDGRRDDGLGLVAAERLEAMGIAGVDVITAFQFQPEHAQDLQGADVALFIDAAAALDRPFVLRELVPAGARSPFSHAMSAAQVLAVRRRIDDGRAPAAFMLAIRGTDFGVGFGLSVCAERDLGLALECLRALLARPVAGYWRSLAEHGAAAGPAASATS